MFLRKEVKRVKTGSYKQVSFCKDCDSDEIETIQTCKKCGSHNIGHPSFYSMIDNDTRGLKPIYEDKEFYVYKCDNCGKEFDGLQVPNIISFSYDEFVPYKVETEDQYESEIYTLPKDLCDDCKKLLVSKLNKQLEEITNKDNVLNTLNKL